MEFYGNLSWPPGTTVHAASNGKTWESKSIAGLIDGAWHTWRMRWDDDGFKFWRDYVDGAAPYFTVPPKPIRSTATHRPALAVQQSRLLAGPDVQPGHRGPGGGDPS